MDDKGSSFTDDEQKQLEWLIGEDSTLKDDESKSYGSKINKDECDSTVTVID